MQRTTFMALVVVVTCSTALADDFRPIREVEIDGQRLLIDNTHTRLSFTVETETGPMQEGDISGRLFPSYVAAAEAVDGVRGELLPSVNLLYAKGKATDDGAYAAVDLAAETDFGPLRMGKPAMIRAVIDAVLRLFPEPFRARDDVLSHLASALAVAEQLERSPRQLGVPIDPDVGDPPVGFYTWSEELEGIYRRDKALQQRWEQDETAQIAILALALADDPGVMAEYRRINALHSALTNPICGLTVDEVISLMPDDAGPRIARDSAALSELRERIGDRAGLALLQPSRSKEMFLLWEAAFLGLSSIEEMITAIRDGHIDLQPDEESGWYEYQQHALEPLLLPGKMPEGGKLTMDQRYRDLLEEQFKAIIGGVRETHVRQLELIEGDTMPVVAIEPHLSCEPLATSYLRFGRAYGFLREVLRQHLGEEALTQLHALGEGAVRREPPLGEEITGMRRLMEGAYLLSCRDIGLEPTLSGDHQAVMAEAESWLENWRDDPDMERDVRFMIPVARVPNVYWGVIGVRLAKVTIYFEEPPEVRAADTGMEIEPRFDAATYWVPIEESFEVIGGDATPRELSREEFRELCDSHETREEILNAITAPVSGEQDPSAMEDAHATPLEQPIASDPTEWTWRAAIVPGVGLLLVAVIVFLKQHRSD